MESRFNMGKIDPGAYRAMSTLDQYVSNSSIDAPQQELIRIRASQINGCAYCVNLHSQDALKLGEAFHRVNLVSAWKESGDIFSSEEQLLLAMTEEITLIHKQGLSEILFEKAISVFGEKKTAQIIMIIIAVNAWNRIGVGLRMRPEIQEDKKRKEIVHS